MMMMTMMMMRMMVVVMMNLVKEFRDPDRSPPKSNRPHPTCPTKSVHTFLSSLARTDKHRDKQTDKSKKLTFFLRRR